MMTCYSIIVITMMTAEKESARMNIERVRKQLEAYKVANEVLELAGTTVEQFCEIKAASDKQRDFANDLKVQAVESAWKMIRPEYHNQKFAQALVAAVLDHQEARFWCDRPSQWAFSAMHLLKDDFKKHLGEV